MINFKSIGHLSKLILYNILLNLILICKEILEVLANVLILQRDFSLSSGRLLEKGLVNLTQPGTELTQGQFSIFVRSDLFLPHLTLRVQSCRNLRENSDMLARVPPTQQALQSNFIMLFDFLSLQPPFPAGCSTQELSNGSNHTVSGLILCFLSLLCLGSSNFGPLVALISSCETTKKAPEDF